MKNGERRIDAIPESGKVERGKQGWSRSTKSLGGKKLRRQNKENAEKKGGARRRGVSKGRFTESQGMASSQQKRGLGTKYGKNSRAREGGDVTLEGGGRGSKGEKV